MKDAFSPFRPVSAGIDAAVSAFRIRGDERGVSPLRSALLVVFSSLEAVVFYLVSLVFVVLMAVGGENQGIWLFLGMVGLAVIWTVLFGWAFRLARWLARGEAKSVRIRRKLPARGDFMLWVEDEDGRPWKGAHRTGPWVATVEVGSGVMALVDSDRRRLLWIPPPCPSEGPA